MSPSIVQIARFRRATANTALRARFQTVVTLVEQLVWLFVLALPVASIAWTVTHEEILSEPRNWCMQRSESARTWFARKLFYLFTCEYCFSHYVAALIVAIAGFKLLLQNWVGYGLAWLALVWVANQYMSLYAHLRLDIRKDRVEIKVKEKIVKEGKPPRVERPAA